MAGNPSWNFQDPASKGRRADFALYEAKRRGRNTVCNYETLHQLYDVGIAI